MVTTEWGLRHPNGYIRWCISKSQAEDMKAGRIVNGRPGDWVNHTLVRRTRTTVLSEPEEV